MVKVIMSPEDYMGMKRKIDRMLPKSKLYCCGKEMRIRATQSENSEINYVIYQCSECKNAIAHAKNSEFRVKALMALNDIKEVSNDQE